MLHDKSTPPLPRENRAHRSISAHHPRYSMPPRQNGRLISPMSSTQGPGSSSIVPPPPPPPMIPPPPPRNGSSGSGSTSPHPFIDTSPRQKPLKPAPSAFFATRTRSTTQPRHSAIVTSSSLRNRNGKSKLNSRNLNMNTNINTTVNTNINTNTNTNTNTISFLAQSVTDSATMPSHNKYKNHQNAGVNIAGVSMEIQEDRPFPKLPPLPGRSSSQSMTNLTNSNGKDKSKYNQYTNYPTNNNIRGMSSASKGRYAHNSIPQKKKKQRQARFDNGYSHGHHNYNPSKKTNSTPQRQSLFFEPGTLQPAQELIVTAYNGPNGQNANNPPPNPIEEMRASGFSKTPRPRSASSRKRKSKSGKPSKWSEEERDKENAMICSSYESMQGGKHRNSRSLDFVKKKNKKQSQSQSYRNNKKRKSVLHEDLEDIEFYVTMNEILTYSVIYNTAICGLELYPFDTLLTMGAKVIGFHNIFSTSNVVSGSLLVGIDDVIVIDMNYNEILKTIRFAARPLKLTFHPPPNYDLKRNKKKIRRFDNLMLWLGHNEQIKFKVKQKMYGR